jgi:hypothetical protein
LAQVLACRLGEIAQVCLTLREVGINIIDEGSEGSARNGSIVEMLACHAGALADSCIILIEGQLGVVRGDFIEWRMSPHEREHLERLQASKR